MPLICLTIVKKGKQHPQNFIQEPVIRFMMTSSMFGLSDLLSKNGLAAFLCVVKSSGD